ncbi:hypothetical protein GCM10009767_35670 [Kocuria aegyptia]|uniref:Uncharacterized protein n=1 Tax=Kocuria aegyptia TaxID=330943 RepID=A0ABN2L442_9MICC
MLSHMATETEKTPGNMLMASGALVAGLFLLLIIAAITTGGGPAPITVGGVLLGLLLVVVGFARRILAAVEKR